MSAPFSISDASAAASSEVLVTGDDTGARRDEFLRGTLFDGGGAALSIGAIAGLAGGTWGAAGIGALMGAGVQVAVNSYARRGGAYGVTSWATAGLAVGVGLFGAGLWLALRK